ncbi:hypothetical protein ACFTWF_22385 [Rhodococcus sp. NPDC056960]|uniref:hypothetical protein n=1 Tax=Rhodococcus sp. NPDC056960 TaxID=3345982 RepID=UPI003636C52E
MKIKRIELAAAIGAGYLLGRTRQLKTAVKIARVGGPQDLLSQGSKFLTATPETAQLSESARDELLDTTAAANEHVESVRDRIRSGGETVRSGGMHLATEMRNKTRRHRHPAKDTADKEADSNGTVRTDS